MANSSVVLETHNFHSDIQRKKLFQLLTGVSQLPWYKTIYTHTVSVTPLLPIPIWIKWFFFYLNHKEKKCRNFSKQFLTPDYHIHQTVIKPKWNLPLTERQQQFWAKLSPLSTSTQDARFLLRSLMSPQLHIHTGTAVFYLAMKHMPTILLMYINKRWTHVRSFPPMQPQGSLPW